VLALRAHLPDDANVQVGDPVALCGKDEDPPLGMLSDLLTEVWGPAETHLTLPAARTS
jgi:hypothetical protein